MYQYRFCSKLIEILHEGIWLIDHNGLTTFVNPQMTRLLGYTAPEMPGRHFLSFVDGDSAEIATRFLERSKRGVQERYDIELRRKDGTRLTASFESSPITDVGGNYVGVIAAVQDITERKRTEEALRSSEGRFRDLTESTADMIWEIDVNSVYTYVNPNVRDVLGYEPKELFGKTQFDFMTAEERRRVSRAMDDFIENRQPFARFENIMLHKDGRPVILESSGVPFFDAEGRLAGYRGVDRDITERKQAEEALKESEEFNSSLLLNSPTPIVVIDPDTSIRYVNPALEKLTGFSSRELVGQKPPYPWWIDARQTVVLELAVGKGVNRREELYQKKNGEQFWVEVTSTLVKSGGVVKHCLGTWVDITQEKRLKENLQFYIAEITRAQEEERKRISRELHDDTAQTLADLYADIFEMAEIKDGLAGEAAARLKCLGDKIGVTLEGVRRFSQELRPELLDYFGLKPSLELLVDEVRNDCKIDCSLEVAGSERRLPDEAELVLFRVAQEALRNVKKHSLATEATVTVRFTDSKVKMTVTDNGGGFAVPQVLSSLARNGKLGLMGMQERVRLLSGNLKIDTAIGKGTTVRVEIPVKKTSLP